jgi:hypothetical protein
MCSREQLVFGKTSSELSRQRLDRCVPEHLVEEAQIRSVDLAQLPNLSRLSERLRAISSRKVSLRRAAAQLGATRESRDRTPQGLRPRR